MTAVNRATLEGYFVTGARPTQDQFANLIESNLNLVETSAQSIVSDVSALGSFSVSGAFDVGGAASFKSNVNVSGNLVVTGSFAPTSQTVGSLTVTGQSTLAGVTISGTTSAQAINAASLAITGATVLASAKGITPALGTSTTDLATTAFANPPGSILSANGSRTNTDGSIEKWGTSGNILSVTTAAVVYATAFPTACWSVVITARNGSGSTQSHDYVASAGLANFDLFNAAGNTSDFFYRSIGK